MKDQYIGPSKVIGVEELSCGNDTTGPLVKVFYDNEVKKFEIMPKLQFDLTISEEKYDFNELRQRRTDELIRGIQGLCMKYGLNYCDLGYVMQKTAEFLEDGFERATSFLWTGDDSKWIKGVSYAADKSFIEAELILNKIKPYESNLHSSEEAAGTATGGTDTPADAGGSGADNTDPGTV